VTSAAPRRSHDNGCPSRPRNSSAEATVRDGGDHQRSFNPRTYLVAICHISPKGQFAFAQIPTGNQPHGMRAVMDRFPRFFAGGGRCLNFNRMLCSVFVAFAPPLIHSGNINGRCDGALALGERGALPVSPITRHMQPKLPAGRRDRQGGAPPLRMAPRTPSPRPKARPRSTTGAGTRGLGWRHWGAITGPWWSLGAPARSAGRRLSADPTAGRPYEGLPTRWIV
jgi:hypothetical protein